MTDLLRPCRLCNGEAWEQVRGLLVEGDSGWVPVSKPGQETSNGPDSAPDTRVTCRLCDNATGWNRQDFADYTRFLWNRENS